jgi:hypothetical protein
LAHDLRHGHLAAPCDAAPDAAPSASRPIVKLARNRIQKKGRAVVDLGTLLHGSNEEKELHELRIECKKLLAMGALIHLLEAEKITVCETFPDIFADFVTAYRKVTL